jgi:diaminohydroxyphosphoribosylaminopyrimidine deaminase / 5-amino-6-(5-phosphoribosylamino)uracil reductase
MMDNHLADEQFLKRALELAGNGIGLVSPNPHVGAIIVDSDGKIAGSGTYTYDGVKHAEVIALEQAGPKARGGTLYINLEPHAHQGRTPPCTDALIAAGIRRVVACMSDPNSRVSGRGFEKLRAAGVQVEVGRFEGEARRLNEAFARYIRHGVPLVTLKSAMTLDGKIAVPRNLTIPKEIGTPPGGWITGEAARAHVQELRHRSDAILVGIGTVLADDPLLTDRSGKARRRPLLRVILDSHLRLPLQSRLVQTPRRENVRESDLVVFYSHANESKKRALQDAGIRIEQVSDSPSNSRLDLQTVLHRLGQLEITSLLIEGGSTVNGTVLAANLVDKLFLYYAPKIMAFAGAVPFVCESAFGDRDEALRLKQVQVHQFGEDVAIEGYLRDPYLD